jgi:hypothetical protein
VQESAGRSDLRVDLAGPLHLSPVILVSGSAGQADLIVASIFIDARPGKTVRATAMEEVF